MLISLYQLGIANLKIRPVGCQAGRLHQKSAPLRLSLEPQNSRKRAACKASAKKKRNVLTRDELTAKRLVAHEVSRVGHAVGTGPRRPHGRSDAWLGPEFRIRSLAFSGNRRFLLRVVRR